MGCRKGLSKPGIEFVFVVGGLALDLKNKLKNRVLWMKKGPHIKPDQLRGGLHGGLTNSET